MSKVFVTGDTHASIHITKLSSKKFLDGRHLTKNDYVIVCGDFGLVWDPLENITKEEIHWTQWLTDKKWTTLFVCGNHENHNRLKNLPTETKFGGTVGVVNDSIYHLKRGEIYTINDKTFFCFGGALSQDRYCRKLNISYWEDEVPNNQEMEYAVNNLREHQYQVNYILTHTAPRTLIKMMGYSDNKIDPTTNFLEYVASTYKFDRWFCGHFHEDQDISKYSFLFDRVLEVE